MALEFFYSDFPGSDSEAAPRFRVPTWSLKILQVEGKLWGLSKLFSIMEKTAIFLTYFFVGTIGNPAVGQFFFFYLFTFYFCFQRTFTVEFTTLADREHPSHTGRQKK